MSTQYWESLIEALFHNSPDAIVYFDTEEKICNINQKFTEIFGYTLEEIRDKNINDVIDPERQLMNYSSIDILNGEYVVRETVRYSKQGEEIPVIVRGVPLVVEGEVIGGYGIVLNMTDLRQTKEQISIYAHALDYSPNSIIITDSAGTIEFVNRRFTEVTGYSPVEAIGQNPRILKSGFTPKEVYDNLWETIAQGHTWRGEIQNRKKNGNMYWESVSISCMKNETGEVVHYVAAKEDITNRKELEQSNYYLAYHDPLTGLPNRVSFINSVNELIDDEERKNAAVLMIDLDRFKKVNDSLGHDFGDILLQSVAERLQDRISSDAKIFRIGGDEFTVLINDSSKAVGIVEQVIASFLEPFEIIDKHLFITVSIGISVYPDDGEETSILHKNADTAMYEAKEHGRNQYVFYKTAMNARAEELLFLENELRQALHRQELRLHYQPQVDTKTKRIVGLEALVRWQHPRLNIVSPGDFIPVAEETGLIVSIGKWVLNTACKTLKRLHQSQNPTLTMAVNISVKQFMHGNFIEDVIRAVKEADIEPCYLELEVTESIAMHDIEMVVDILHKLRKFGVLISIDDFGTGYSSLNNFRSLPINKLKIDQSFVSRITFDQKDVAIVKSVIAMAHSLNLTVVAEGVETIEQFKILSDYQCDTFQGYLYSRPVSEDKLSAVFAALEE